MQRMDSENLELLQKRRKSKFSKVGSYNLANQLFLVTTILFLPTTPVVCPQLRLGKIKRKYIQEKKNMSIIKIKKSIKICGITYAGNNIYDVSDKFIINKVIRICISYTV